MRIIRLEPRQVKRELFQEIARKNFNQSHHRMDLPKVLRRGDASTQGLVRGQRADRAPNDDEVLFLRRGSNAA